MKVVIQAVVISALIVALANIAGALAGENPPSASQDNSSCPHVAEGKVKVLPAEDSASKPEPTGAPRQVSATKAD